MIYFRKKRLKGFLYMKYLIASDIHGSAKYAAMVKEAFVREGADKLILLGDLLYHGPRNDLPEEYAPKKVIEILNSLSDKIIAVRGNCDAEVDQMVLCFPIMADYAIISCGDHSIFATHGHKITAGDRQNIGSCDIFLYGHTHVPECRLEDGLYRLNPGSASIPKEGSAHGYMTFDGEHFARHDLTDGSVIEEITL